MATVENFVLKVTVDGTQKVKQLSGTIEGLSNDMAAFGVQGNAFSNTLGSITSKLGPLGAAASAAALAFAALGLKAISIADQISDLSAATDISSGALLNFKQSIIEAGGKADDFTTIAAKLNQSVQEAAGGNEKFQKAFQSLGVYIRDANGNIRSTETILQELTDQFQRGEISGAKYAAAIDVLGKTANKLDLTKLSAVNDPFKDAQIAQLAKYQGAIDSLTNSIENRLIEVFGRLALEMQAAYDKSVKIEDDLAKRGQGTFLGPGVRGAITGLLGMEPREPIFKRDLSEQERMARLMAPAVGKTRANTAVAAGKPGGDFGATPEATVRAIEASEKRIAQSRAEIEKSGQLQANADRLQAILTFANQRDQIEQRSSAQIKDIEITRDAEIAKARSEIFNQERLSEAQKSAEFAAKRQEIETKAAADTAKARTQLQEQLAREDQRIQDITKSSKDLVAAEETRLEIEKQRLDLANIMLTATDRERKNAEDLLNIEVERLAKLQEIQRIKDLPDTERVAREQEINKIYDTRKKRTQEQQELDLQASQNFGAGYQKAFNQYIEDATNAFSQGQEVFGSVTRNMESALDQFVETGKLNFGDFAKSLIMDIIKIELRAQAAQYLKALMGGGGSGSFLGSIFGSLFGGGKAGGGPVTNSKAYMVGEQGPELFVPNAAGSIIPNNQLGGSALTQVTYNINAVDASSFRSLVASDPEFIFAVTEQGRRRLPNSRR